jgi:hypothetical protein
VRVHMLVCRLILRHSHVVLSADSLSIRSQHLENAKKGHDNGHIGKRSFHLHSVLMRG